MPVHLSRTTHRAAVLLMHAGSAAESQGRCRGIGGVWSPPRMADKARPDWFRVVRGGRSAMIRELRLLALILFTTAGMAWPAEVAAQRHAPRSAHRGGGAARAVPRAYPPRSYRPYSHPRYYYPNAYRRYYAYAPWYHSGFGFGFGFGWPGAVWGTFGYGYRYPYRYTYGYPSPYGYPYTNGTRPPCM